MYINQVTNVPVGFSTESKRNTLINDDATELTTFTYIGDVRSKRWFIWNKAKKFAK